MVLDATSATSASAGPTGYMILLPGPSTCQHASVDLGAGGAVTPIGPIFDVGADGCPFDLAIRAGDARIWAVVQAVVSGDATTLGPGFLVPAAGEPATGTDEPVPAADGPAAAAVSAVLVTIDPTTGVRTPVGPLGIATGEGGALAFDAAGTLWYYGQTDDPQCGTPVGQCLYRLDPATGAATFVATGPNPIGDGATFVLGGTASCERVLANALTLGGTPFVRLNTVDTTTGALTATPTNYGSNYVLGLERDAAGTLWGIGRTAFSPSTAPKATFTIDPVTGAATKVADLTTPNPTDVLVGLAIAGLTCPVELAPRFTG